MSTSSQIQFQILVSFVAVVSMYVCQLAGVCISSRIKNRLALWLIQLTVLEVCQQFNALCCRHLLVNPKERRVVVVESLLSPTVYRDVIAKVLFKHYEVDRRCIHFLHYRVIIEYLCSEVRNRAKSTTCIAKSILLSDNSCLHM